MYNFGGNKMAVRKGMTVKEIRKKEIVLKYNPYTYETSLKGIELGKNSILKRFLYKNKDRNIQVWYKELFLK